jgi:hypothetical protein
MAEDRWNGPFRLVGPDDLTPENWDLGVIIQPEHIHERTLHVIIPEGTMNSIRQGVFDAAAARANSLGVKLTVTPVR